MGVLDERLKKAQEKAAKEISEKPYLNIEDFIARAKFPPNCAFKNYSSVLIPWKFFHFPHNNHRLLFLLSTIYNWEPI